MEAIEAEFSIKIPGDQNISIHMKEKYCVSNGSVSLNSINVNLEDTYRKMKQNAVTKLIEYFNNNILNIVNKENQSGLMDTADYLRNQLTNVSYNQIENGSESISEPELIDDEIKRKLKMINDKVGFIVPYYSQDKFSNERCLGKGGFGEAYYVKYNNMDLCVKYFIKKEEEENMFENLCRELKSLLTCHCEYIVKGLGITINKEKGYGIVLEYANGGDLRKRLNEKKLDTKDAYEYSIQLTTAVKYLQEINFVHRDIKPANIFFKDGKIKLGDFGLCRNASKTDRFMTCCGTPSYEAPEVRSRKQYNIKADIYSLGLVIYELFTNVCLIKEVFHDEDVKKQINDGISKLVCHCLDSNSHERPDAVDILKELKELYENYLKRPHDESNKLLSSYNIMYQLEKERSESIYNTQIPCIPLNGDLIESSTFITEDMIDFLKASSSSMNQSSQLELIYKSSRDGATGQKFHEYCDNIENTIVFIKHMDSNGRINIFGGYASKKLQPQGLFRKLFEGEDIYDDKAFIFSLVNPHHTSPQILRCLDPDQALRYYSESGPQFGDSIVIGNDFSADDAEQSQMNAITRLNNIYEVNDKYKCSLFTNTGHKDDINFFKVEEMEVFKIVS
ncbi:hypothetical protein WA158_006294 [Blastocystis sp. Blastoise]